MFTLITLVDESLADECFIRHVLRTYQGFDRLFRLVDIRKYRASDNTADVTILDRFAMFAAMFYEGISYESLLDRLSGTKDLVFMTSDLHFWSIFPQAVGTSTAIPEQVLPAANRYEQLFEMFDRLGIRHLITNYECPELEEIRALRPTLGTHVIDLHIDPAIFKDYGLEKEYDVIIYGATLPAVYPFRHRVSRLLTECGRFNVLRLEAKSPYYDPDICGEGLARKINRSWLGLATTSNFDYLVGKYFEIPACRSVVLGNMNEHGRRIFGDRYVHIDEQMPDNRIIAVVSEALADRNKLEEVAAAMHGVISTNFTLTENERKLFDLAGSIQRNS